MSAGDDEARRWRWLASGWLPAGLAAAGAAAVLHHFGVDAVDLAAFGAYLALGITLPGTLIWRALISRGPLRPANGGGGDAGAGTSQTFAVALAAGTALGYCLEVLSYLGARALGVPLLVVAWPIATIAIFAGVPRLRRHWRGPGPAGRLPSWLSWLLAGLFLVLVLYSAATFFRDNGLGWSGGRSLYVDMPFQIAMAGEVKHHVPAQFPYVAGEPLVYHWFVYLDFAATSWITGIEVQVLVLRLSILPMLAAFILLTAALARRVTGLWWAGAAALAILYLAPFVNPYRFTDSPALEGSPLNLWPTPTQVFGMTLFAAAMLVLVDLVKGGGSPGRWLGFTLLLAVLTGARATLLPMLAAGLAVALVVPWLIRRRWDSTVASAFGLSLAALLFAQYVLYRGEHYGLVFAPLSAIKVSVLAFRTGLVGPVSPDNNWPTLVVATALVLVALLLPWSGVAGLARRPTLTDPALLTLVGVGVAGLGAALTFGHPGLSQVYFLTGARPYLAVAAACGLVALARPAYRWWLSAAVALGCAIMIGVRHLQPASVPRRAGHHLLGLIWTLSWPYLFLLGIAAVITLAILAGRRRGGGRAEALRRTGPALATVAVLLTAYALPSGADKIGKPIVSTAREGWANGRGTSADDGTIAAARWLRAHSHPDDLVATNLHCRLPAEKVCDNRHFSVAAFAERRVLVEGWGYSAKAMAEVRLYVDLMGTVPYWDPQRLADNDAAFTAPSAENIARLRDTYGVRWLFADASAPGLSPTLGRFAREVFRAGDCDVYALN